MTNRFGKTFGRNDSALAQSAAYMDSIAKHLESTLPDRRAYAEQWIRHHQAIRNANCEAQKNFRGI